MVTTSSPTDTAIFHFTTLLGADRIPEERTDCQIAHFRRARRDPCEIPCDLSIVLKGGTVFDVGTATLANLSPSGALLVDIELSGCVLPLAPFTLTLRLRGPNYEGIRIEATPIRFSEKGFSLGVRFEDMAVELG